MTTECAYCGAEAHEGEAEVVLLEGRRVLACWACVHATGGSL